jgi:dTMP kinase
VKRGIFITFEGGEGSGKSTQARLLADALKKRRIPVVHTREPGGTSIAESVRKVLLNPASRIAPLTELLLYEAARAQHLAEVVVPALRAGRTVICERYTDATEAYQGYGRGLDLRTIQDVKQHCHRPPFAGPHLPAGCAGETRSSPRRGDWPSAFPTGPPRANGGDRMERESAAFHGRVRRGYLRLARGNKTRRFRVIPWGGTIERVHAQIFTEVNRRLHDNRSRLTNRSRKFLGKTRP